MEYLNSKNLKPTLDMEDEQNIYHDVTQIDTLQENYEPVNSLGIKDSLQAYYNIAREEEKTVDANKTSYIMPDMTDNENNVDISNMQATAAINQSLMYQNEGFPTDYPFQMLNGMNTMNTMSTMNSMNPMNSLYGGISQYYGGMNVPMTPYHDPYGIINPLACVNMKSEPTKKKTKRFYCC
ncbi:conserved protein, unknown function [Hepatocystis sp. ex Piliocolobus tephrosceles]|nr:conserved protein, unknown function [Hepatocystis sp. ex Piliocolobus tephrosceles]